MNNDLHIIFEKILRKIGFTNIIQKPVFYNAEFGLRFEIGHGDIHNEKALYVQRCVNRAEKILNAVEPDIIRVDIYPDEDYYTVTKDFLIRTLGFPEDVVNYDEVQHLYWQIINSEKYISVLKEIILSDIGGEHLLNSCVYFVNSNNNILYHLYDDRGADIVSNNKDILKPLYNDFNNWILEYDRKRIDESFIGGTYNNGKTD